MSQNEISQFSAWYPIVFSKAVKPNQPYSFQLFNEPFVLFRDTNNQIACLQDRCPHRSTPLSLGRVVNGELECRYHGWRFNREGQCVAIPALATAARSPEQACAISKPTQEYQNLIWIWYGQYQPTVLIEQINHHFSWLSDKKCIRFDFSVDAAIPYELMIENLLDPAHLPFAHHGTLSKRSKASPITFDMQDNPRGLSAIAEIRQSSKTRTQMFSFDAPFTVYFDVDLGGRAMRQVHYCLPLTKTTMRLHTLFFYKNFPKIMASTLGKLLHNFFGRKIVKQDINLLAGQYKNLTQGAKPWHQAISADKLAHSYRQWFKLANDRHSPWFNGFNQKV